MKSVRPKSAELYKSIEKIEVFIWGKRVGAVALDPGLGYYVFAYDEKFLKTGIELAPLHMPLNHSSQVYVFGDLPELTYKRLPALLADALPDDFGNALIDRYMAEKGIAQAKITVLDRLAYMGKRGMGALEFKPVHGPKTYKPTALKLNELVTEARKAVEGTFENDEYTHQVLRNLIEVGTSAGGARAKAVIAWNPKTEEIRSGQVDAPEGFEHWLLKFDGVEPNKKLGLPKEDGKMEYAYFLMARAAGISMMDCRLLEEGGRSHFMTKRFDRQGGHQKHHIQTLCAMNHLDYKKKATIAYEQLFVTLSELNLDHATKVEAFRRMVFNVMGRNCDDHTKNFSFLMHEGEGWALAPAYDVTFAYNPDGRWTNHQFLSVNGKYHAISLEDLLTVADRFGIGEASSVIQEVREAILAWPSFAKKANLNPKEISKIKDQHWVL